MSEREALRECSFVPVNEPWTCSVHGGIRTRLDEPQCDRVKPAEPFNDAYLDNLRQSIAEGHYPQGLYNIRRLLATIDALRAALAEAAPPHRMDSATLKCVIDGETWPCSHAKAEAAPPSGGITLDTMFADVPPSRALDGWVWECVSCDRPVPPMGMCETCGVFGVMRLSPTAEPAMPGELPLNASNGPWCGCGQRLGHAVPNVDCSPTAEPAETGS